MIDPDLIFEAVADAKAELGLGASELVCDLISDRNAGVPGVGITLESDFLSLVAGILCDRYIQDPSKTHLKKYVRMKLEMDIGM